MQIENSSEKEESVLLRKQHGFLLSSVLHKTYHILKVNSKTSRLERTNRQKNILKPRTALINQSSTTGYCLSDSQPSSVDVTFNENRQDSLDTFSTSSRSKKPANFSSSFQQNQVNELMYHKYQVPSKEEAEALRKQYPNYRHLVPQVLDPLAKAGLPVSSTPTSVTSHLGGCYWKAKFILKWPLPLVQVTASHPQREEAVDRVCLLLCQAWMRLGLIYKSSNGHWLPVTSDMVTSWLDLIAHYGSLTVGNSKGRGFKLVLEQLKTPDSSDGGCSGAWETATQEPSSDQTGLCISQLSLEKGSQLKTPSLLQVSHLQRARTTKSSQELSSDKLTPIATLQHSFSEQCPQFPFSSKVFSASLEQAKPTLHSVPETETILPSSIHHESLQNSSLSHSWANTSQSAQGQNILDEMVNSELGDVFGERRTKLCSNLGHNLSRNVESDKSGYKQEPSLCTASQFKWRCTVHMGWPIPFSLQAVAMSLPAAQMVAYLNVASKLKMGKLLLHSNASLSVQALEHYVVYETRRQWKNNLYHTQRKNSSAPRRHHMFDPDAEIFCDVSSEGFGAYLLHKDTPKVRWISESWSSHPIVWDKLKTDDKEHLLSTLAEMFGLVSSVFTWKSKLKHSKLLVFSDNATAVTLLNVMSCTPISSSLCLHHFDQLIHLYQQVCADYSITAHCVWLDREKNHLADQLSRHSLEEFRAKFPTASRFQTRAKKLKIR